MHHGTPLISTIVAGFVFAFILGAIANRFRLPPLVGYLVAGILVGPHTPGFVADQSLAPELAEIGVILLMFGVGLHFSLKDLMSVRLIAVPGAIVQIAFATLLGWGFGAMLGWPTAGSLVFGLALSVASTVVLLKALQEKRLIDSERGRIAVGWLIVEDLAMVLALVLIPAAVGIADGKGTNADPVAVTLGELAGIDLGIGGIIVITLLKVAAFVGFMLVVGRRLIPWILHRIAHSGSRELFRLGVLAIALGVAFGAAELFGVSLALGAFFAGMVLSESELSHRAAQESLPLRDAFAVLFFVSVGMLFDPMILVHEPFAVLAVVLVIVLGKTLAAFGIVMAFGYPASTALTVSASLAQVGEFSFILTGLGVTLGLLPPEGRDLILAGALLSITLNPLVFAGLDRLSGWLRRRPGMLGRLERQRNDSLSVLPPAHEGPRDHAVIVGYGRVGSVVGKGLKSQNLPIVVIDQNRRRVEALRKRGVPAVYGDATTPGVLEAAGTRRARLIVVATPQGYQTRRVLDLARRINPSIDTAVRTHSEAEVAHLERQGVGLAIMGERELAFGLMDYALRSFGSSDDKVRAVVQGVRVAGEGGVYERRHGEPWRGAPELRQHRDEVQPPD